jgi:hypothetical protein
MPESNYKNYIFAESKTSALEKKTI